MNDLTVVERNAVAQTSGALSVAELRGQLALIQEVMRDVMTPGVDYGYIPGTEPKNEEEKKFKKPALFQAGAEKLCVLFRLGPDYEIVSQERQGDHLTITSRCTLTHIPTGNKFGSALGSCSTMESKYAYRKGARKCPSCGAEAIIKGKEEYGGGWVCFAKKGGCGSKFHDGDPAIESQQTGKVANEDKADQFNTVLKMANKRAFTSCTKGATAASAIFSVDIVDEDDVNQDSGEVTRRVDMPKAKPKPAAPAADSSTGATPSPASAPAAAAPVGLTQGMVNVIAAKMENAGLSTTDFETRWKQKLVVGVKLEANAVIAWILDPVNA